jgi:hypothetical protein
MSKISLGSAPNQGHSVARVGTIPLDTSQIHPVVGGSIDSVRQEIDDVYEDMKTFHNREPDEIMRLCRGHSARLSELRLRCQRVEDTARQWKAIRTREIEPTLDELRDQWQNASRLHSVREFDWKLESGLT